MKVYKGTDEDMKCRGLQYEIGKEVVEDEIELCKKGLHACENPLDVLTYYKTGESRYFVADAEDVSDEREKDSKIVCKRLTLLKELTLKKIITAGVEHLINIVNSLHSSSDCDMVHAATMYDRAQAATTGYKANAVTTGYEAHAATTGNRANAATTGYEAHALTTGIRSYAVTSGDWACAITTNDLSHAATTGYGAQAATNGYKAHAATTGDWATASATGGNSLAAALGVKGRAKAKRGNYIVLAEYDIENVLIDVKVVKVDGDKIKADTWYMLKDGEFVEFEGNEI